MSSSPEPSSPFTSWSIPAVLTFAVCVFVFVWFYLKLNRKRSNEKLMAIGSAGIETVQRQNQTRQDRLLFESEQKRILYHDFRKSHAFVQVCEENYGIIEDEMRNKSMGTATVLRLRLTLDRYSGFYTTVRDPGRTAESLVKEHTKLVEDIYYSLIVIESIHAQFPSRRAGHERNLSIALQNIREVA